MKQQSGFTLIELIAVIVILGIIAATAVPRFVDLTEAARESSVQGVAGALGSASALNHANNIAHGAGLTIGTAVSAVTNCTEVAALLDGGLPADYAITSATIASGAAVSCTVGFGSESDATVVDTAEPTANFTGYGVASDQAVPTT